MIDTVEDRTIHVVTGAEVHNQINMVWVNKMVVEGDNVGVA
jgi:hypothetical protein